MRHVPFSIGVSILLLLFAACEQETVDLSAVMDPLVWTTIDELREVGYAGEAWGSGPNDIYIGYHALSDNRVLRHFDGTDWEFVPLGSTTRWVGDIWGSSASDVYATTSGTLWHFNGSRWGDTGVGANGVTGTASDNVFALDTRHLLRFTGLTWDTLLTASGSDEALRTVWAGPGPSAIVFLAHYTSPHALVRWNDALWTPPEPVPGVMNAFWGPSANGLLAAGYNAYGGMVWRWDGWQWTPTMLSGQWPPLSEIFGFAPNDVYAVGCQGVIHYDGAGWQLVRAGEDGCYRDVWGSSPSDVYLVYDREVLHNGSAGWQPVFDPVPVNPTALWADTRERVVVGSEGAVYRLEGGKWSEEGRGVFGRDVHVVAGNGRDDLYAATSGAIYHFDGMAWSVAVDSIDYVEDMVVLPSGHVFTTGLFDVHHFDTQAWTLIHRQRGGTSDRAIWAAGPDDVWVVDRDGVLFFNGTSWAHVYDRAECSDVWGSSARNVYVVSSKGILHSDGVSFERVGPLVPGGVRFITGTSSDHVIAVGDAAYAAWQDGRWQTGSYPPEWHALSLAPAGDGSIVRLEAERSGHYRLSYHRE